MSEIKCEHDLQTKIIKLIRERGGVATRVNSGSIVFKRSGYTNVLKLADKGTSDIIACYQGRYLAIEVKFDDGKPSEEQIEFGKTVNKAGGIFLLAYNLEDVDGELDILDREGAY